MLDIPAALEGYKKREISNIGFVRSSTNLADGFTKSKMRKKPFKVLQSGKYSVQCKQWIIQLHLIECGTVAPTG